MRSLNRIVKGNITPQQRISGPQIFGYTEDQQSRVAETLDYYTPSSKETQKYSNQNQVIQSLMKPDNNEIKAIAPASVTPASIAPASVINPVPISNSKNPYEVPEVIEEHWTPPTIRYKPDDLITINKSTLIIFIAVIITIFIIQIWLRQRRIELMLVEKNIQQQSQQIQGGLYYNTYRPPIVSQPTKSLTNSLNDNNINKEDDFVNTTYSSYRPTEAYIPNGW